MYALWHVFLGLFNLAERKQNNTNFGCFKWCHSSTSPKSALELHQYVNLPIFR